MSPTSNPDPDLMRIFNFTANDLEANRAGKISERQSQRLQHKAENDRFSGRFLGVLLAFLLVGVICYTIQNLSSPVTIVFPVIISIALFICFIITIVRIPEVEQDLKNAHINVVEGNFTLKTKLRGKTIDYIIDFGTVELFVDDREFTQIKGAVHKNGTYRAYYLPKSLQIIAAEIIE